MGAKREVYVGFSTVGTEGAPFTLTDIDLVKQDLLNTFNTKRGERVMRPTYGTVIFDLLMDPFDDITTEAIRDDVINIINAEPRVQLVDIDMRELEKTIRIDVTLNFTPGDVVDTLFIEYNRQNDEEI